MRDLGDPRRLGDEGRHAARIELARALDQRPPQGLGGVRVDGDAGTTLRLDRRRCDQSMLDAVFPAGNATALWALGFRRVYCGNDAGALALEAPTRPD